VREHHMRVHRVGVAGVTLALLLAACGSTMPHGASPEPLPTTTSSTSPVRTPSTTAPTTTTAPLGFVAESVTFVSSQSGWVLGTDNCAQGPSCAPVLLHTENAGQSWTVVAAPADDSIDQVRFADAEDGWLWGTPGDRDPDVWSTHDGGTHWSEQQFPALQAGAAVFDVEASAGVVQAAFGTDPIQIQSSPVQRDDWVPSPTTLPLGAGPVPRVQFVLQGTTGWALEVDRTLVGGARLDNGGWVPWNPASLTCSGPVNLAAPDPSHLVAVCDEGAYGTDQVVSVSFSDDAGSTFHLSSTTLPTSTFGPVASPAAGVAVMAGSTGLMATFNSGATWTTVYAGTTETEWIYVGFTTPSQGVAIDGNGTLLMTFDGGRTWTPKALPSEG
jgi:photosystem II stability/assembly factor-like uncharacterized protein